MKTPEPRYEVLRVEPDFEIRRYESVLVAESLFSDSSGRDANAVFRVLAGYIFGKNTDIFSETTGAETRSKSIAMTAPVNREQTNEGLAMQFFLPPEFNEETVPVPLDPRVKIRRMPEKIVAVRRYSGSWDEAVFHQHSEALLQALRRAGYSPKTEPILARYDPPWKLWFLRRNEVWVELEPSIFPGK